MVNRSQVVSRHSVISCGAHESLKTPDENSDLVVLENMSNTDK